MADRRVIILEKTERGPSTSQRFNVLYWLVVPVDRRPIYAKRQENFVSVWPGISGPEAAKFTSGEWTEVGDIFSRPSGGMAAAMTDLEQNWQKLQDELNADTRYQRYGSSWDGTTWDVKNYA